MQIERGVYVRWCDNYYEPCPDSRGSRFIRIQLPASDFFQEHSLYRQAYLYTRCEFTNG